MSTKVFLCTVLCIAFVSVGLIFHMIDAKAAFLQSNKVETVQLTGLSQIAFSSSIYDSRLMIDKPHLYHPNMPQISYKFFIYE